MSGPAPRPKRGPSRAKPAAADMQSPDIMAHPIVQSIMRQKIDAETRHTIQQARTEAEVSRLRAEIVKLREETRPGKAATPPADG